MPKLEFKLRQITPMIHFQGNERGATIRATELKPLFDKFLARRWRNQYGDQRQFLIQGGNDRNDITPHFDYRVTIESPPDRDRIVNDVESGGSYFGNNDKRQVFCNSPITIRFITRHNDLLTPINYEFPIFIATHNFGFRNNKGYGSFIPIDTNTNTMMDANTIQLLITRIYGRGYKLRYTTQNINYSSMIRDIAIIYKYMKSGINCRGNIANNDSYHASFLMKQFFLPQNINNEKKYMKLIMQTEFRDISPIEHGRVLRDDYPDVNTFNYTRVLLGKAEQFLFRQVRFNNPPRERNIEFRLTNSEIERFKSPITFKPGIDGIYIFVPDISTLNNEILNQEFTVNSKCSGDERDINLNENYCIRSPEQFDIYNFLDEFMMNFNNTTFPNVNNPLGTVLFNAKQRIQICSFGGNN